MIILFVIIGLSILILGHELGHFFAAKLFKLRIDEFGFGFPPRIFAKKKGETEYSFNALPFGGFVKIAGENDRISGETEKLQALSIEDKKRIFLFQPAWKRAVIILAGVLINFVLGWILFSATFMIGTPQAVIITTIEQGSPAEKAGIAMNDILKDFKDSESFINFVNTNKGKEIEVAVLRGGEEKLIKAVPRVTTGPNEGALGVGLSPVGFESENFFSSIASGFKQTIFVSWGTVQGFYMMIKGLIFSGSLSGDITGPVGIFSLANQIGQIGWAYLINLMALISINLAVINLIPFPALDGGRFFMILIEKIKGSPVPIKVEAIINGIGFALLLALMVFITARDIIKLF